MPGARVQEEEKIQRWSEEEKGRKQAAENKLIKGPKITRDCTL